MKIKELISELSKLNPNAKVVLGSDSELNTIYQNVVVNIFDADETFFTEGEEIELTDEITSKIKEVVIWGHN